MKKIFLLCFSVLLSADSSFEGFMQNMKNKTEQMKNNNPSYMAKKIKHDNNIPTKQEILSKNKKLFNHLDIINKKVEKESFKKIVSSQDKKLQDLNITHTQEDKKVDTIFYLFSMSQSEYMFYNFVEESSKLEKVNKNIKYYGVVQGMLKKKDLQKLYTPFEYHKKLQKKAIIKMQPFIFKDLKLHRVPVYLFSKCSDSEFKYKKCENKYLVRGEISLQKALEIVSKTDKYYSKYLKILEHGDY